MTGTRGEGSSRRRAGGGRRAAMAVFLVTAGLGAAAVVRATGIRFNLSPSIPIGIYMAEPAASAGPGAMRRGTLVAVCLPLIVARWGRSRGYLGRGRCDGGVAPVGKPIFAVGGDTVVVGPRGLTLCGVSAANTRPLVRDAAGRLLPRMPSGRFAVAADELWLVSTYSARSWDSRYYGPVPVARVVEVLRPLLIARR